MQSFKNNNNNSYKEKVDMDKLPKHIAIIMDGNGRWAKKRLLPRTAGHREGVKRVLEIVEECGDLGIEYLTLYAFSTENWNRPEDEIDYLMKLLVEFLRKKLKIIHKNGVRLNVLGDITKLDESIKKEINDAIKLTENNSVMTLNIALNYGGRDEIIRAVKKINVDIQNNNLEINNINEEVFKKYLDTNNQPDPDILIRTSGEQRISNFLNYQIAYSEFFFTNIKWPDFKKNELYRIIFEYQNRNRRFGGV